MKNDHHAALDTMLPGHGVTHFMDICLRGAQTIHVIRDKTFDGTLCHGHHCHETWEIFGVLSGHLRFACLGQESLSFDHGAVVLVPPGCLHISIDELPQARHLRVLVFNLPGSENPHGMFSVGKAGKREGFSLDKTRIDRWETLLGMPAHALMDLAAAELAGGAWGGECALARLRLLFAAYAELMCGNAKETRSAAQAHLAKALNLLQSRYYEPNLSIAVVAEAAGLSASHLTRLFRQFTGKSPHQTLTEIRLRRAASLLGRQDCLIKEIAQMTGWNNQLYFSAAFRRHYGCSPTAYRLSNQ